jgi:hypothetical protein
VVEWLGHETDHSPPTSANAKNDGAILPLPHVFMAWCLLKHRDTFSFTVTDRIFSLCGKNTVNMDRNIGNICQVICIPASLLTGAGKFSALRLAVLTVMFCGFL